MVKMTPDKTDKKDKKGEPLEVLTATELDQARCAAVLARYLPLGEEKAEAWAEMLCRRRSAPLPGEADSG